MTTFFCTTCQDWTQSEEETGAVRCTRCGDNYVCDECGAEIDAKGACQRFLLAEDNSATCKGTS